MMAWRIEKLISWSSGEYVIAVDGDGRRGLVANPSFYETEKARHSWGYGTPEVDAARVTPLDELPGNIGGILRLMINRKNWAELNQQAQDSKTMMFTDPDFHWGDEPAPHRYKPLEAEGNVMFGGGLPGKRGGK
jgi:hypothetical protein